MKNILSKQTEQVINSLPTTAKIIVFIVLFGIVFTLWRITLWSPLQQKKEIIQQKTQNTTKEIKLLQQSITSLQNVLAQKKYIQTPEDTTPSEKTTTITTEPSPQKISQTLKALLATNNLNLVSLDATNTKITVDQNSQRKTFEHKTTIQFTGTYFASIKYIETIEKLNWPIYWDTLTYTVTKYPEANVMLEIHTISTQ